MGSRIIERGEPCLGNAGHWGRTVTREVDGPLGPTPMVDWEDLNVQVAPFPRELEEIVSALEYRPGWRFRLVYLKNREHDPEKRSDGLTFEVLSDTMDTYHPDVRRPILHQFPVPPATYNRESWLEWVRDRLIGIEVHEACEYLQVDGKRPFAPGHAPGWDPYQIRSVISTEAAETDWLGRRHEGTQE